MSGLISVDEDTRPGYGLLTLAGDVRHDIESGERAREEIQKYLGELSEGLKGLCIDLSGSGFTSSPLIGIVGSLFQRHSDKYSDERLSVIGNELVRDQLRISGLLKVVDFYDSLEIYVNS